jgi:hypothetical protein
VLSLIISQTQSAFIPGRLITDNVLVAFEALHTKDVQMKGREGFIAVKLDISKAYDRVELRYLEEVMRRIGFAERWISMAMTWVRTVTLSTDSRMRPLFLHVGLDKVTHSPLIFSFFVLRVSLR